MVTIGPLKIITHEKVLKDLQNFINSNSQIIDNVWIDNPGPLLGEKGSGRIDVKLRIRIFDYDFKTRTNEEKEESK